MKRLALLLCLSACTPNENGGSSVDPTQNEDLLTSVNDGNIDLVEIPATSKGSNLIGGTPADRNEWPASFTTSQGSSRCTGTLIGERVLQLAAHCVGNGKTATITSADKKYSSTCYHSPKYAKDSTADYALCLIGETVPLPWYEGLMLDPSALKVGDKILLAGMGCVRGGGGGGNDDVFRTGESPVTRLPTDRSNDIITKTGASLCFGDSGGSAFWKDPNGVYRVVGINSRGSITVNGTSYLSSVFTPDAVEFYQDFAKKHSVKICGMAPDAPKCRGAEEPRLPAWCKEAYTNLGICLFGNQPSTNHEQCKEEYVRLFACVETASDL